MRAPKGEESTKKIESHVNLTEMVRGSDWLNYDEDKSLMTSSVCGEYYKEPASSVNLKGQTFLKGSTHFKISAIVDHERSVSHLKAASAFHTSKRRKKMRVMLMMKRRSSACIQS